MNRKRLGFTLVELLTVIVVLVVLLAIVLPAIQGARESSRSVTCKNNLRQTSVAIQAFHDSQDRLPSLYNGSYSYDQFANVSEPRNYWEENHFHSWQAAILPQLEEAVLYDRIDMTHAASDPANQEVANSNMPLFVCPSSSNPTQEVQIKSPNRVRGTSTRTDYESIGGVELVVDAKTVSGEAHLIFMHVAPGVWGLPQHSKNDGDDISFSGVEKANFRMVSDGLSKTMTVGEIAGQPDIYANGKLERVNETAGGEISRPSWAISGSYLGIVLHKDTRVNRKNRNDLYSFHPAGANAAFADGSVRLINKETDTAVVVAMATRTGGEEDSPSLRMLP